MEQQEKYVIFAVKDVLYGIPIGKVREIIRLPEAVTAIPHAPATVSGVVNLRGTIIPVHDLRVVLGHESLPKERVSLVATLKQREQDHKNWLAELENACAGKREFKLQRNPHLCAFGKWYDANRHTLSASYEIRRHLDKFDAPHKAIHGVADSVDALMVAGRYEDAQALVSHTKTGTLADMLNLFAELYPMILAEQKRDLALVLDDAMRREAVSVDSIDSIDGLTDIASLEDVVSSEMVSRFGMRGKKTVLILDYKLSA